MLLLIISGILVSGCFSVNDQFRRMKNHLLTGNSDFETKQEFALGYWSLTALKTVLNASSHSNIDARIIGHISNIQIGTYIRSGQNPGAVDLPVFQKLCSKMTSDAWIQITRSYDHGKISAVFLRINREKQLHRMFVVSMEDKELMMIDICGNLDEVLKIAIQEKGLNLYNSEYENE